MVKTIDISQIKKKLLFLFFTIVIASCSKKIEVPLPIPDFSFAGGNCIAPCEIQIKNLSTNYTTFSWEFGDGAVSTDKDPKHFYQKGGTYTVKLTVKGDGGTASISKPIIIGNPPDPIPDFSFTDGDLFISSEIIFTNKSINSITYIWDFGDGSTSTDKDPKHIFNKIGSFIITLTASSTIGVKKSTTKTIELKSYEVNKLTIKLGQTSVSGLMIADGKSKVSLDYGVFDKKNQPIKNIIPLFYANGVKIDGLEFKTTKIGEYNIIAQINDIKSNTIKVTARESKDFDIVRLPVVVHLIGDLEKAPKRYAYPVSVAYLKERIAWTNDVLRNRKEGNIRDANECDTFIELYLEEKAPDGTTLPIAGIHKIDSPLGKKSTSEIFEIIKKNFWNPNKYVNFYIVDEITEGYSGYAGYTQVGGNVSSTPINYIVLDQGLGPFPHEFGHYLNLNHPFDRCSELQIKDIPLYLSTPDSNKPTFYDRINCDGIRFTSFTPLDYGGYWQSYTYDQRKVMRSVIDNGVGIPTPKNLAKSGRVGVEDNNNFKYFGGNIIYCNGQH